MTTVLEGRNFTCHVQAIRIRARLCTSNSYCNHTLETVCNVQSKEETLKSLYTDTPAFVEIHVVPSVLVEKDAGEKVDVLHYTHADGRHVPEGETTGTIGRRECTYSSDCI